MHPRPNFRTILIGHPYPPVLQEYVTGGNVDCNTRQG
jgi:hypothetical protein